MVEETDWRSADRQRIDYYYAGSHLLRYLPQQTKEAQTSGLPPQAESGGNSLRNVLSGSQPICASKEQTVQKAGRKTSRDGSQSIVHSLPQGVSESM